MLIAARGPRLRAHGGHGFVDDSLHLAFRMRPRSFGVKRFLAVEIIVQPSLMTGPMVTFVSGHRSWARAAMMWGKVVAYQLVRLCFVSHVVNRDVGILC